MHLRSSQLQTSNNPPSIRCLPPSSIADRAQRKRTPAFRRSAYERRGTLSLPLRDRRGLSSGPGALTNRRRRHIDVGAHVG